MLQLIWSVWFFLQLWFDLECLKFSTCYSGQCYLDGFFLFHVLKGKYTVTLSWILLGRGHTKETGTRDFRELLSAWVEHMLLNGAAQIEEKAMQFPQFALLRSVTCVQLRLITILGNCSCQFPWCALTLNLGKPTKLIKRLFQFQCK
jgi:hypothetical protein